MGDDEWCRHSSSRSPASPRDLVTPRIAPAHCPCKWGRPPTCSPVPIRLAPLPTHLLRLDHSQARPGRCQGYKGCTTTSSILFSSFRLPPMDTSRCPSSQPSEPPQSKAPYNRWLNGDAGEGQERWELARRSIEAERWELAGGNDTVAAGCWTARGSARCQNQHFSIHSSLETGSTTALDRRPEQSVAHGQLRNPDEKLKARKRAPSIVTSLVSPCASATSPSSVRTNTS